MSLPESNSISPQSSAPAPVPAPFDRWRWMLAGVIGILGGYLTLSSLNTLPIALRSMEAYGPEQVLLVVSQFVFALVVASFAFWFAPGPVARRGIAIAIFVVLTIALVAFLFARITGGLPIPGQVSVVVANPYWVLLAAGGVSWLLACGARPIAYLTLLLTFIVMPLPLVLGLNNIPFAISTLVQLPLALVIAVVILLVSRPAATTPAPAPTSPERSRWLLGGVIGILGGYLTLSSMTGQLTNAIGNPGGSAPELLALFVAQGLFALVVTAFAYLVATGPVVRRVLAAVLFAVLAVALVALLVARYWGDLRLPGPGFNMLLNPVWIVLLVGGLGWLLASGARSLAYLSLLLTLAVIPLGFLLTMNNVEYGLQATIQYAVALAVAVVILLVSRPAVAAMVTTPPPPGEAPTVDASPTAEELAPTAFVAMDEGAESSVADGAPAEREQEPRTPAS